MDIVKQLITANKEIVSVQENNEKLLEKNEKIAEEEKLIILKLKGTIEINKSNLVAQKSELDDKIIKVAAAYNMTASEKESFVKEQQAIATQTSILSDELEGKRQKIIEEEEESVVASKQEVLVAPKSPSPTGKPVGVNNSGFMRPSNDYTTSPFGYRIHPITGERKLHGGIDFAGSGTVLVAGYHSSWGYYVKIDHENGLQTLLCPYEGW
ncbi:M23 family metallopeptidase [Carnobacterium funditum]|uniref:M23 family metallopeptidase n=1 Tax=Carnobacterium funditum TaxID=2752 RepID=UPI000AF82FAC|nr:hypothetical protein [Carnobacterium funditum]